MKRNEIEVISCNYLRRFLKGKVGWFVFKNIYLNITVTYRQIRRVPGNIIDYATVLKFLAKTFKP
jgi:hypothetical protein